MNLIFFSKFFVGIERMISTLFMFKPPNPMCTLSISLTCFLLLLSFRGGGGGNPAALETAMTAADARQQQLQPVENVVIQADYELEYREPETKAQRDFLKSVFKQEHQRYLEMHQTVSRVSEGFVRLENQMHQFEHGSLAWKVRESRAEVNYCTM